MSDITLYDRIISGKNNSFYIQQLLEARDILLLERHVRPTPCDELGRESVGVQFTPVNPGYRQS